jgi:hypothetical protein
LQFYENKIYNVDRYKILLVLMAETDIKLMLMYDETLQTVSFDGRDRHKGKSPLGDITKMFFRYSHKSKISRNVEI